MFSGRPCTKVRVQIQRHILCLFNSLTPLAADLISADYPNLRQITECAADLMIGSLEKTFPGTYEPMSHRLQFREAEHGRTETMEKYKDLPSPFKQFQGLF